MDSVVLLALFLLAIVFFFSLCFLLILCQRRKKLKATRNAPASPNFRFSRLQRENVDSLAQLSPLLDGTLENCDWLESAQGSYEHSVLILRLSATIVKQLSQVDLSKSSPQTFEVIGQAMLRITPQFDELASFHPALPVDLRIVEARATSLVTVVWALATPYMFLPNVDKAELKASISALYSHLDNLRETVFALDEDYEPCCHEAASETVITHVKLTPSNPPQASLQANGIKTRLEDVKEMDEEITVLES